MKNNKRFIIPAKTGILISKIPAFAVITLVCGLLTACGGDVKEQLGMRTEAPDEFAVERRPKLDIPPAFKIRAPIDESEVPRNEIRTETKEILFGENIKTTNPSNSFMSKLGIDEARPDIRATIVEEYGVEDPDLLDRIRSISDDNLNKTLVDAKKERERIAENVKEGKSPAEGESVNKTRTAGGSVIDKLLGE